MGPVRPDTPQFPGRRIGMEALGLGGQGRFCSRALLRVLTDQTGRKVASKCTNPGAPRGQVAERWARMGHGGK